VTASWRPLRARLRRPESQVLRSLVLAALAIACSGSSTAPRLGDDIDVRYGASVRVPGDTVQVQFTAVTSDSRCPSGAQCIWAGEAAVLFTVGGSEQVTLTLGANEAKARTIVRGTQMLLVALKPYPTVSGSRSRSDYVATIRFTSAKD